MKQLRFFDVTKEEWEFLKTYHWAKKEHSKWISLYQDLLQIKKEYLEYLLEIKNDLAKDVIDYEDLKAHKIVTDSLEEIEKLDWLPQRIEDISIWIEFNRKKASKIS